MTNRRSHWQNYKLGELVQSVDYGLTASATNAAIGPKFLRITDIQNGCVDWDSVPFCNYDGKEQERFTLASGDIVFARTGATTGKSFRVTECPDKAVYASYLIRVRPGGMVDSAYLARFFQTPEYWQQITKNSTGTAQAGVNATNLKGLVVPLPPLPEQKRIAAILDKADALREKRRQTIAKLDTLLQSVFLDMFGGGQWNTVPFSTVVQEFRYGTSNKSGSQGKPALRIPNIVRQTIDFEEIKLVPVEKAEFERLQLQDGDMLFVRTNGNPDYVGRCAVFDSVQVEPSGFPVNEFIYASYLIRARLDRNLVNPCFVQQYLASRDGRKELRSRCQTSAGQYNINTAGLGSISVLLPPLSIQKQFADKVNTVKTLYAKHIISLQRFDNLFNSLQQRAFNGELFTDHEARHALHGED